MFTERTLGAVLIAATLAGCLPTKKHDNVDQDKPPETDTPALGVYVQPITNLATDFIKGADISTLAEVERGGATFFNTDGTPADAIELLADKGVNWVRLRLWNNPYYVSWQETHWEWVDSDNGNAPYYPTNPDNGAVGAGTNDLATTIALATRAKAAGMQILLDFHYSDFWADPGKQYSPDAWKTLTDAEARQALYSFTYDSLVAMADAGVFPNMIQVGNEINNGLMWDNHGWWDNAKASNDSTYDIGIGYLEQGIAAIEAAESYAEQDAKIMLHLAEGGNVDVFDRVFGAFADANLAYDIIGASYYPYWHGSLADLQANLDAVSAKYNKDVVVAEVAYGYTTDDGKDGGNIFNASLAAAGGFLATVQGQTTAIREVMNVVAQVPNGKGRGIFYWEPAWLANEDIDNDGIGDGAGWIYGEPSSWDNQTLFDADGKALASLDVFAGIYGDVTTVAKPTITQIDPVTIERMQGDALDLPNQIDVLYSDDAYRATDVSWQNAEAYNTSTGGEFELTGTVNGREVIATLVVIPNVLQNSGFESGDLSNWTVPAGSVFNATGDNPHTGSFALHFWSNTALSTSATQTVTNISNGSYNVSVWVMGASTGDSATQLSATSGTSTQFVTPVFQGFGNWNQYSTCVDVTNQQLTVTIDLVEAAGSWGEFDDVRALPVSSCL